MIHVTHDQEEAMTLGDRIAVMRDGAAEQIAPPLDVYQRPANVFVATFVGSPKMNLLDVAVDGTRRRPARARRPGVLDRCAAARRRARERRCCSASGRAMSCSWTPGARRRGGADQPDRAAGT